MVIRKNQLSQALALALMAGASTPVAAQDVDLGNLGNGGFRLDGAAADDLSGTSVSGAGDVNGDGLADLIVGAFNADPNGALSAGSSYVVFGKTDGAIVSLGNLGSSGFRLDGAAAIDLSGISVSGAGDVNGDGLADLIVGARKAVPNGVIDAGSSYVVFGKADGATVNLGNLGSGGFRLDGVSANDYSGTSVSGAGDVNGDGLADLIVGAKYADPNGALSAGLSYVVFGKTDGATVNLGSLGSGGFRVDGATANDQSGASVSGAGDVNGDGLADLIVSAPLASPNGVSYAGSNYIVFGKADGVTVNLGNLVTGGFRLDGADANDKSGASVSSAGDVNGDGLADLIVGALYASPNGVSNAGSSYVVFGKTDGATVNLSSLGSSGFRLDGALAGDFSGISVSGAGDVNGDGLADLILGAFRADPNGAPSAGSSYLVFGKTGAATVDLGNLGNGGFRLDGVSLYDYSGGSVSGAGDVNGDGLADLIVGANDADPNGAGAAGSSYVVFSQQTPGPSATYQGRVRNGDAPRLALGTSGDGSNASHPDSRAWIDFADGADATLAAAPISVTLTRSDGNFPAAISAADVSWQLTSSRVNWTSAGVQFRYTDGELLIADESLLVLFYSPTGDAPFTRLTSVVNPLNNTISAVVNSLGFFYIGSTDFMFMDGFE